MSTSTLKSIDSDPRLTFKFMLIREMNLTYLVGIVK